MNNSISYSVTESDLQQQICMLEDYLRENFEFRHNVLSDDYEMRECNGDVPKAFRPLTREARNSLLRRIKHAGIDIPNVCQNVDEYIYSEETPVYDPAHDWLLSLPGWDGKNHVGELFGRLPGINTEQHHLLAIWLRSAVAHWLGMDMLHGNESVVTLIGAQGCGKSTFCMSLLPPHLRTYYLDHINLGNKNDKEMALTSNLIVNIDELDQVKQSQQAELKQSLSKVMVNGRPIYGRAQKCRRRYASFVSTTNNPRPLSDPTGSRRYLCIRIPDGQIINNADAINYDQLYAQVVHEVRGEEMRYWFTHEETRRIELINHNYQRVVSLENMISSCFRHPEEDEMVHPLGMNDILDEIATEYPNMKNVEGLYVRIGKLLTAHNFDSKRTNHGKAYYIVPRSSSSTTTCCTTRHNAARQQAVNIAATEEE